MFRFIIGFNEDTSILLFLLETDAVQFLKNTGKSTGRSTGIGSQVSNLNDYTVEIDFYFYLVWHF